MEKTYKRVVMIDEEEYDKFVDLFSIVSQDLSLSSYDDTVDQLNDVIDICLDNMDKIAKIMSKKDIAIVPK